MVPHDQQLEVSSPGMINDDLDSELAIKNFGRTRRPPSTSSLIVFTDLSAGEGARATLYAENDVPQPQDFDEFGFTNTKPCCIRVSW